LGGDVEDKYVLEMEENCNLITSLRNRRTYSNKKILEIYKARWEIEVFFKYLKNNFKFQHMKEKNKNGNYEKTYISSLIITYIAKIIVKDFFVGAMIIMIKLIIRI
jgi:IS4 transposase